MPSGIEKTKDEVKALVISIGYNFIDCYNKNRKHVVIQSTDNYKYDVVLTTLLKNKKPELVHPSNPFSLENVSLWLKTNNKFFELTSNNIYMSARIKLEFCCLKCNNIFYKEWYSIKIGKGCPYCSGTIVSDKNRLSILCPEITKDWDCNKNNGLSPSDVSYGSGKRAWWKCVVCGYEWNTEISWRGSGKNGCPCCGGQTVTDKNRLSILFPDLVLEWNFNKNRKLIPSEIACSSNKKIWWKCSICGYEWIASPNSRTRIKSGCPACAGKVVTDKNRLSILYPDLIKEWDFTRNGNLIPNDISFGSGKTVWWVCSNCGNNWKTRICIRTTRGSGCPKCNKSNGEKRISKFLDENNITYTPQYRFQNCRNILPLPFDFYLLDYKTLIEYQGLQHYKEVNNDFFGTKVNLAERQRLDKIKSDYCFSNNIPLLIIPYRDFDNIENILSKELKLPNLIKD